MRKEDLNKLCSGEIHVLKTGNNNIRLLLVSLLLSANVFPQVPINGFCKFNKFEVDPGYTSLFSLNFNNDFYTDLVIFNKSKKEISAITGDQSGNFLKPRSFKTQSEISSIQILNNQSNIVSGYAWCSRKSRKAGIISFSKNGKPLFENELTFSSYPENISSADLTGNGENALLVSGSSFDGLSVLHSVNRKLKETRVTNNSVYSFAQFADLSNDGFPDIAAFNLISLNLDLFYNKGNGEFNKVRSIPVSEKINSLRIIDIDFDSYQDIIISKNNSIEILYGDFSSSFERKKTLWTEFSPDKIITGDFNKDGKIDIAYLDTGSGTLSVFFGKDNRDFYPEVIYFSKKGCTDLIPYYSRFINGIAVLNKSGALYTITNFASVAEETNISLGVSQQGLNYFDHNHDGIVDICFIDNVENKLDLILRNSSGKPYLFYSIPLNESASDIYVDNHKKNIAAFYCYTKERKLIEAVTVNFQNSSVEKKTFYVGDNIIALRGLPKENGEFKLFAVQLYKRILSVTVFNNIDAGYLNTNFKIADNVINAATSSEDYSNLYFWQNYGDSFILSRTSFSNNFEYPEILHSVRTGSVNYLLSFAGDLITNYKDACFSIIKSPVSFIAVTLSGNSVSTAAKTDIFDGLQFNNIKQFYVGATNFKGADKIFFNNLADGKIVKIDLVNRGRSVTFSPVADAPFAGDYFIKNLNMRNYHLVYINKKENCITIKPL
jgi:hypothetical protein